MSQSILAGRYRSVVWTSIFALGLGCPSPSPTDNNDTDDGNPIAAPNIGLSVTTLTFAADAGGANPTPKQASVTNIGTGNLAGLTATVTYSAGMPNGWLTATLNLTSAPATLAVSAVTGALPAGTYTGTVSVASSMAGNSPRSIDVTFTVANSAPPSIAVSQSSVDMSAEEGGTDPAPVQFTVSNAGSGSIDDLQFTVASSLNPALNGWLTSVTLSGTSTPATMSLQATTVGKVAGTYSTIITITSASAASSIQVPVTFTITSPGVPAIGLSRTTVDMTVEVNAGPPAPEMVTISNVGAGTIADLTHSISVGSGQPLGWLMVSLSAATTPATLTLQPSGTLLAGTYDATITISSAVSSNSPRTITVTHVVTPGNPAIGLSATTANFTAEAGATSPPSQVISISNTGTGSLTGMSANVSYGSANMGVQASAAPGWLLSVLSSSTGPATLTLHANISGLSAGTYVATVTITSPVATNSPQTVTVTFTVTPAAAVAAIGLSAPGANIDAPVGSGNAAPVAIAVTNEGAGSLTGLSTSITYQGGQPTGWLTATLSSSTAPATVTLQAATGALPEGVYDAVVSIASPAASNSPRTLGIKFTVTPQGIIGLSVTSVNFTAQAGGGNPASSQFTVTNAGSGSLTNLASAIGYPTPPSNWLVATFSSTTAPATVTLQATTGALTAGTYDANVFISGDAANSPQTVTVTFTVTAPPPSAPVLSGPSSDADGTFDLTWTYAFAPCNPFCSSQTGYQLEESATSSNSGFTQIFNSVGTSDRASPKTVTVPNRPVGTYWYRVRASDGGFSPYSNVIQVTVTAPSAITAFATTDNLMITSTVDPTQANTVFPTGDIGVGCNFAIGPFASDFVCFSSVMAFSGLQSQIAGRTIVDARLKLFVTLLPADLQTTYAVNPISQSWSTGTLTYNNQPNIFVGSVERLFVPPVTAAVPVEVDVTNIVQAWANGSLPNHGLMIRDLAAVFPPLSVLRLTGFASEDSAPTSATVPRIEIIFGASPSITSAVPSTGEVRQGKPVLPKR